MSRYAVLLDGGFVTKSLSKKSGSPAVAEQVIQECTRICSAAPLKDLSRPRIDFYDALSATGEVTNPIDGAKIDLGKNAIHRPRVARMQRGEIRGRSAVVDGIVLPNPGFHFIPSGLRVLFEIGIALPSKPSTTSLERVRAVGQVARKRYLTRRAPPKPRSSRSFAKTYDRHPRILRRSHLDMPSRRELKTRADLIPLRLSIDGCWGRATFADTRPQGVLA
ncbi:MAG: hypothetical protein PHQ14_13530 [Chromatiales bacterium]|nr:hypothetical protein [Chromatiales bacterium]